MKKPVMPFIEMVL